MAYPTDYSPEEAWKALWRWLTANGTQNPATTGPASS